MSRATISRWPSKPDWEARSLIPPLARRISLLFCRSDLHPPRPATWFDDRVLGCLTDIEADGRFCQACGMVLSREAAAKVEETETKLEELVEQLGST